VNKLISCVDSEFPQYWLGRLVMIQLTTWKLYGDSDVKTSGW